jgi:hypothetical protein
MWQELATQEEIPVKQSDLKNSKWGLRESTAPFRRSVEGRNPHNSLDTGNESARLIAACVFLPCAWLPATDSYGNIRDSGTCGDAELSG